MAFGDDKFFKVSISGRLTSESESKYVTTLIEDGSYRYRYIKLSITFLDLGF